MHGCVAVVVTVAVCLTCGVVRCLVAIGLF
jgi:hypothetical protein